MAASATLRSEPRSSEASRLELGDASEALRVWGRLGFRGKSGKSWDSHFFGSLQAVAKFLDEETVRPDSSHEAILSREL